MIDRSNQPCIHLPAAGRFRKDWLEPQMENIYYHKRPAIQEHNVSANKDMLTIGRRRRQLPFKIDGNSINPPP